MICDVMPNGLIGAYMEEGYPIYLVSDKLLELLGYTYEEFMKKTGGQCTEPHLERGPGRSDGCCETAVQGRKRV